MPIFTCEIPLLRASIWSGEPDPELPAPGHGFPDLTTGDPDVGFVAPLLRRRLSRSARGMLHCAHRVAPADTGIRTVFASRHGEMDRTVAILKELHDGAEISPALFSLSVHNAVAGLWSIAKGSREASTSIAAGPDTFGWGLLEAFGTWQAEPSAPVLFVYGDDDLPDLFKPCTGPDGGRHALE